MYHVSIELGKHEWKFGRTRNAVGTREAGLFIVAMHLAIRAPSLALNKISLKITTGRRQTSWLFTKRDRGFELVTTEKQILLVLGWRC